MNITTANGPYGIAAHPMTALILSAVVKASPMIPSFQE